MTLRPFATPLVDAPLDSLEVVWERSDAIFGWLDQALAGGSLGEWTRQALLAQPIPSRPPFIFYLGHLPAFAWSQVGRGVLSRGPFDERRPEIDEVFGRAEGAGGDGAGGEGAEPVRWPDVVHVLSYRYRVRSVLRELAGELPARAGEDPLAAEARPGAGARILHLVLEHELAQHETLTSMVQVQEVAALRADPSFFDVDIGLSPADDGPSAVRVPAGQARLGAAPDDLAFAWDHETPPRRVDVPSFRIARRPVTNGDFRHFVAAGGYEDGRLWEPGDQEWLAGQARQWPVTWRLRQGRLWTVRAPFVEVDLDEADAWPVQLSHAEASAYARWKGARLPTEAELIRAAYGDDGRPFPWGAAPPSRRHGAFCWSTVGPTPVGSHPDGRSAQGIDELIGNGQEWTSTEFAPHPGFQPTIHTWPGHSADFFDGQHVVALGASFATDRRLLRRSFRRWYPRRYPWAFTKFRLAWSG